METKEAVKKECEILLCKKVKDEREGGGAVKRKGEEFAGEIFESGSVGGKEKKKKKRRVTVNYCHVLFLHWLISNYILKFKLCVNPGCIFKFLNENIIAISYFYN